MKKILQLLGILAFVICNYGNAKELKCEYELKNLNIEPVRVANAKRTYTVYISCKYTSVHHTGETGGPIPLRKTITPVVTGTDDEKEGKAEAYAEGESTVIAMARLRLTEECGLQCGNCNEVADEIRIEATVRLTVARIRSNGALSLRLSTGTNRLATKRWMRSGVYFS